MGEMGPIKGKEGKSLTDNNTKIVLHEFLKTVMNKSKPEGQEKKPNFYSRKLALFYFCASETYIYFIFKTSSEKDLKGIKCNN